MTDASADRANDVHSEVQALRQQLRAANEDLRTLRQTRLALEQEIATLRCMARKELPEHEANLRGILNAAHESIWLFSAEGKVLFGNETALHRWGAPLESVIGKHVLEALPGSLGESLLARVRETATSAAPVTFEDEHAGLAFEHRFYPVSGSDGRVERVASFSRDVTGRRRTEQERERLLAEVQRRTAELDAIIASMVDGVVVYNSDGKCIFCNHAAEGILRYTPMERTTTDLEARTRMMSYLAEDGSPIAPLETPVAKALRGDSSRLVVMRLPRPGREIWLAASASPIHDPDGRIHGAVATVRDITDVRQMQARMAWLSSFPELNPLPITEVSLSGQLHYINPAARRLFPDLENLGLGHAWLSDWQAVADTLAANPGHTWERDVNVADHHFHQSLQLLPDISRIRIYGSDITSRVRTERALREGEHRLLDADLHKNEFLAVLSHELRNPLAPIRNSLHVLGQTPMDSEPARRARTVIERQTAHMTRLIDDLLDITRISRGKIRLQRRPVELGELVRRATEDLRELFIGSGIALELALPENPIWLDGDATRLSQTVGNLLQNTIKFTNQGGRVWVMLAHVEGQAVLRVRDTGVGLDQEMLPHLFSPFAQAERTLDRSKGGMGLGLALVKGLVELHGGEVSAHSKGLGQGSEFVIRLPTIPAPALVPPEPSVVQPPSPRRCVLIIEDNLDAALSLCEVLELGGHEVAIAYQGPEGLAKAAELVPDVIFCDIGLPGMDGYEVARRVRANPALAKVVLVALSGYALPEDLQRAATAGFDRHIAKPPSLEQLEALLAGLGQDDRLRARATTSAPPARS